MNRVGLNIALFLLRYDYFVYMATTQTGPKPNSTPLKLLFKTLECRPFSPKQLSYFAVLIYEHIYYFFVVRKRRKDTSPHNHE